MLMIDKRMEVLRNEINEMIISVDFDRKKLLDKSMELDILIIESMREKQGIIRNSFIAADETIEDISGLLSKLQIFNEQYEVIRIVDPVRKKVLIMKENLLCETDLICYKSEFGEEACENCVSIRSYYEKNTLFKIECKDNRVHMLTAVPVIIKNKRVVIEFAKHTVNSLAIGDVHYEEGIRIFSLLDQINREVIKDQITDSFNRRYINERFPVELLSASVSQEPLCIIYIKSEELKAVGELYGITARNSILKELAEELTHYIRKGKDWIARYDEHAFFICLPNMPIETSSKIAEKIRKSMSEKIFRLSGETAYIACRFEVCAVYDDNNYKTADQMVEQANKQLDELIGMPENCII
jgi:diguanylate cyclase (GGDEF)-like protein